MLFKPDNYNNSSELTQFSNINPNTSFATISKYIRRAEEKYLIKEILGNSLYKELDQRFNNNQLEGLWAILIEKTQDCLANYTVFLAIDQLHTKVSDLGVVNDESEETEPVSFEDRYIFKKEVSTVADEKAEAILEFLEENEEEFPSWANLDNPVYTITKELFINSAPKFTKFVPMVNSSRRIFRMLRESIKYIEDIYIRGILGQDFFSELKVSFRSKEGLSETQKEIWETIQKITAYYTISEVLPELQLQLNDGVLSMPSFKYGVSSNQKTTLEILRNTAYSYGKKAEKLTNILIDFLNKEVDKYPKFQSSSKYIPKSRGGDDFDYGSSSVFPI